MTGRIPRSFLVSTTHNSLVPFLYETRTLTPPPRWYPSRTSIRLRPRFFSSTSRASVPDEDAASGDTPKPRKTYLQRRAESKSKPARPSKPSKPLQTMTQKEKEIFGNILEQLGPGLTSRKGAAEEGEQPVKRQQELTDEDRSELSQISSIFDAVLKETQRKKEEQLWSEELLSPKWINNGDRYPGLEGQGVPDIRARYHRFKVSEADISDQGHEDMHQRRAIYLVIHRESRKIESALQRAIREGKGDMGIWAICRERIFSMLQYLDPNRGLPGSKVDSAKAVEEETSASTKQPTPDAHDDKPDPSPFEEPSRNLTNKTHAANPSGFLDIPPSIPVESVVVALYPKMLLLAFRLLFTHFPASPLLGQFRSAIKAQGRASAVLGASTSLYNELIYFYWHGCNDLPGVISLLEDMEKIGVEPSKKTCRLLESIVEQRDEDIRARRRALAENLDSSSRVDPWWDLAPNRRALLELTDRRNGWITRMWERRQELAIQRNRSR